MEAPSDYRKFLVLYVDDEEKSLKLFARAFGETFRILTASNAKTGLQLLEEHGDEVGVLMTDQRMPGEKGVWLLEKAYQLQPRLIRILVTAYTDMDAAIAAVNSGAIYRYVTKPWDPLELDHTLKRGLEFFAIQRERDQLVKERMSVLHNQMIADRIISLGMLSAGLSHHIRNALVAVKTFLDLAPEKMIEEKTCGDPVRNPEFWTAYYRNVQGQIDKITLMLKQLGSVSDHSAIRFEDQVQLRDVIDHVAAEACAELTAHSIRFENDVPVDLPTLNVNGPKFHKLFQLLLRDELASLPRGSKISVSASAAGQGDSAAEIEVRVRDDGPGDPMDPMRLFDPFLVRSGSPSEYGIDLMGCYFIVHHHGGSIHAESHEGQGTSFVLKLPVNPAQALPLKESPGFLQKLLHNEALWEKLTSR